MAEAIPSPGRRTTVHPPTTATATSLGTGELAKPDVRPCRSWPPDRRRDGGAGSPLLRSWASSIGARDGGPKAPPRSRRGWPNGAVSRWRRLGPTRTWRSASATCRVWPTGLSGGAISFDKLRAVVDVGHSRERRGRCATRRRFCHGCRAGPEGADRAAAAAAPRRRRRRAHHEGRRCRCNDTFRTVTVAAAGRDLRGGAEPASRPGPARSRATARLHGTSASCDAFVSSGPFCGRTAE